MNAVLHVTAALTDSTMMQIAHRFRQLIDNNEFLPIRHEKKMLVCVRLPYHEIYTQLR